MTIKGWRKLAITGVIGGIIIAKPDMTSSQVELMNTLILAAFAGNGIEHLTEMMRHVRVSNRDSGSPIRSVSRVSQPAKEGYPGVNTH